MSPTEYSDVLKVGRGGFPQEEVDAAIERLRHAVERIEQALSQTRRLAHDMFSLADVSIMSTIVRMGDLGLFSCLGAS